MAALSDLSDLYHAVEDSIIIGIDFGTTFSGVAWTNSADCQNIRIIRNWATNLRHCSSTEKVPTALTCDKTTAEVITWGYDVSPTKPTIRWFKLLLLDYKDVPEYVRQSSQFQEVQAHQATLNIDPVDVTAAFLKHLWDHSVEVITRELGDELVNKSKFHIVITVPAIWPAYAHDRMRKAAQKAGLTAARGRGETKLSLISEPEAAALAVLSGKSKDSTVGDTLVDLISYVVESLNPFEVKECVKGEGDLCGGIFLDEEFLKLIERSLGADIFSGLTKIEKRKLLNDNWEHTIKPQFDGKQTTWEVEYLPASCQRAGRGTKRPRPLTFDSNTISALFDPTIRKFGDLLSNQLTAIKTKYRREAKACSSEQIFIVVTIGSDSIKHVILVGGFGRSPYLYNRLKLLIPASTTIHQPTGHQPWTAICQGAVIIWDKYTLQWRAEHQTEWYVVEGQDLNETTAFRKEYCRCFDLTARDGSLSFPKQVFYFTTAKPPPTRRDDSVKKLCTVAWNKPIEITCAGGIAEFAVIYQGKRVANHSVQVEYH
ncbi:hypothetical protein ACCO45_001039 [Purpureocillium lilacinum]|uniref:Uncharacterized protein n=1 Tax=Purpureocillium lilacinum TaxID=33203 RepID=A0ACC4E5V8_PURLI